MTTVNKAQMQLLEELLRNSIDMGVTSRKQAGRDTEETILLDLGLIAFDGGYMVITDAGRNAYAAQANRDADAEDAAPVADPGPIVRMVAHIKEASMVAYRLGYNGARSRASTTNSVLEAFSISGIFSRAEIFATLKQALGQSTGDDFINAIANFLTHHITDGMVAGNK